MASLRLSEVCFRRSLDNFAVFLALSACGRVHPVASRLDRSLTALTLEIGLQGP